MIEKCKWCGSGDIYSNSYEVTEKVVKGRLVRFKRRFLSCEWWFMNHGILHLRFRCNSCKGMNIGPYQIPSSHVLHGGIS